MIKEILAPMPGKITEIQVKIGDSIVADQSLIVLESMKMENLIVSKFSGVVKEILVEKNDFVKSNQLLLILI